MEIQPYVLCSPAKRLRIAITSFLRRSGRRLTNKLFLGAKKIHETEGLAECEECEGWEAKTVEKCEILIERPADVGFTDDEDDEANVRDYRGDNVEPPNKFCLFSRH